MARSYYNENEPAAAHLLRCLIEDGVIAPGDVDERSIKDVQPEDLRGYTQVHFFAGGGLWSVAARLAGWDDTRPIWTGSCPCQPFSVAGKGAGKDDPRHLWPDFFRLLDACRPPVVMGEQVAGKAGEDWFDGVAADLEGAGYTTRAVDIPACAVDAPHIRQRLYWCAVENAIDNRTRRLTREIGYENREHLDAGATRLRREDRAGLSSWFDTRNTSAMADSRSSGRGRWAEDPQRGAQRGNAAERAGGYMSDAARISERKPHNEVSTFAWKDSWVGACGGSSGHSFWSDYEWRSAADGKARRVKPGICLLSHGFPNRVAAIRIAGNAIVPQAAAQVIAALMETLE